MNRFQNFIAYWTLRAVFPQRLRRAEEIILLQFPAAEKPAPGTPSRPFASLQQPPLEIGRRRPTPQTEGLLSSLGPETLYIPKGTSIKLTAEKRKQLTKRLRAPQTKGDSNG